LQPTGDCAIATRRHNELAAVATLLSLPQGLAYQGAPVQGLQLADHVRHTIEASRAVAAEPGHVEFQTLVGEAQQMIKHGGETYAGYVTLYFDAQL
jgi:hypothetical protein